MAGLDPAIHAAQFSDIFQAFVQPHSVAGRVKPGHDGESEPDPANL